ncbi:hypothetical protein RSSM_02226 [Rhodopirellula sallentina SM41]|uniref:Uncharacterized protein n=1 Tax=Rhodopirellula sallentina SM41 TaxID=1263870 RepID=M5UES2_9BACT|nr:hypothetical protein RSSM_02226 [Rhodopirellula sallentina SM41]
MHESISRFAVDVNSLASVRRSLRSRRISMRRRRSFRGKGVLSRR